VEVKDLLLIAYINEGVEHSGQRLLVCLNKGSPNMYQKAEKGF